MKKAVPYILLLLLALAALSLRRCNHSATRNSTTQEQRATNGENADYSRRGLNRNPSHINYTKHVRCRMGCRHIDEEEIRDILKNGTINYRKSDLNGEECRKKYAVEGYSRDNQHLRVIFAPCNDEMTVVTCIDLGHEWPCDCEGDH